MKNNFPLKTMFTIFSAAPFIISIVMIFIAAGIAESRNIKLDLLEAPKYLIKPIKNIIESGYVYSDDSEGVLMLMDKKGNILYPTGTDKVMKFDLSIGFTEWADYDFDSVAIYKYSYNGEPAFCFFDNTQVPVMLKKHIRIGISFFILLISCSGLVFNQIVKKIINSSISTLVSASELIAEGNLDEKITLKYNNELVFIADAVDKMRLEIREKRDLENRFVMSVTHDLKTPLTSIKGYLEAIADDIIIEPEEIKSSVKLMQKKTQQLDYRINELLDYSKNKKAGSRDLWKSVNVNRWLNEISSIFDNDSKLYMRRFISKIDLPGNLNLFCNEKLMTRALENLFDNGCRYTKEGDSIILNSYMEKSKDKNQLIISIEDSGAGVDETDSEKIFELFYRSDKGRNSRGMGIGLTSVQTIIKDHGGSISCCRSAYGGAAFIINLNC